MDDLDLDHLAEVARDLKRRAGLVNNRRLAESFAECGAAYEECLESWGGSRITEVGNSDDEELVAWLGDKIEREAAGLSLEKVFSRGRAWRLYHDADLATLEDVAGRTRDELATVRGIGPKSMALIDAALSVEGLTYAEAS